MRTNLVRESAPAPVTSSCMVDLRWTRLVRKCESWWAAAAVLAWYRWYRSIITRYFA